jgi:hypothetical protein
MPDADRPSPSQSPGDHESDISALLQQPDFFPLRIDLQRRGVVFVRMSRETFRRSSFLDRRAVLAGPDGRLVHLDELSARLPSRPPSCPAHFILHGAFCGSTLLACHFEDLPHCLVLKEPQLLAQLANLANAGGAGPAGSSDWTSWFDLAIRLLSRADAGDAAVLIKAPDQFNWLANCLLERDQTTKVIFLCAPLRIFLLSALKSEDRREWLRSRGRGLRLQLAQVPLREELMTDELTDGQLGAALWLLNSFLCSNLLARSDADRVLVMNSEDLIHHPQEAFQQAVGFLGLTGDQDIRRTLEAFRPINYYSKTPDLPGHFDAAIRSAALAAIDKRFGGEVDAALAWAKQMSGGWLSGCPFPVE